MAQQPYPEEENASGTGWWQQFEQEQAEFYAKAGHTLDWGAFRWAARTGYDIAAGMTKEAAKQKHFFGPGEMLDALGLPHPTPVKPPLPARPTRQQLCEIRNQFQGLTITTRQFGTQNWFEGDLGNLTDPQDRAIVYKAHRDVRPIPDTHVNLSLRMDGLLGLGDIKAIVREAITDGGMTGVLLMCMGDGHGSPNSDPGALGFLWLMANFTTIYEYMRSGPDGEDLTHWIVFCPGYDGVVPDWQPFTSVDQFLLMAGPIIHSNGGALALQLSSGFAVWSGERNDYETPAGQQLDVLLSEFPINCQPSQGPPASMLNPDGSWGKWVTDGQKVPWTQCYQIVGRLVKPYRAPAWQPDDHNPGYLLGAGTPRGPIVYVAWEFDTYRWCRARNISVQEIGEHRQAFIDMGAPFVG